MTKFVIGNSRAGSTRSIVGEQPIMANKEMSEELSRLREQLSYIRLASQPVRGKRPPSLDLSKVPDYHPYECRPSVGRISAAVGDTVPSSGSSSLVSIDDSSSK